VKSITDGSTSEFEKESLKCPYCTTPISDHDAYCPNTACLKPIWQKHFTISGFLKKNFQLFAIIGMVGTITTLIYAVIKFFYPDLNSLSAFTQFLIYSILPLNGFLILGILMILFLKSFVKREDELLISKRIHIGDLQRALFFVFIVIPILVFILILLTIIPLFSFIYSTIFLIVSAAFIYTLMSLNLKKPLFLKWAFMIIAVALFSASIWVISSLIFPLFISSSNSHPLPDINSTDIEIISDVEFYSPSVLNSIGVGLSPSNIEGKNLTNIDFIWKTDFGYFFDWQRDDQRRILLGNITSHNQNKIFWSFDLNKRIDSDKQVIITLFVNNTTSFSTIAHRSIKLVWLDNTTVKILAKNET
jgi:hypothetical protein